MLLFFICAIIIGVIVFTINSKPSNSFGPTVYRSNNGFEGHEDFLEMHGFITPEEREAKRGFQRKYEANPEQFETMTLQEFIDGKNWK